MWREARWAVGPRLCFFVALGDGWSPTSLFYTWRAVGSPIAGGLQADLGLHWDCCGILDWDPAILSQWDDGRPAWPVLVLYMAGRWFPDCMWILGGFRIALGLL